MTSTNKYTYLAIAINTILFTSMAHAEDIPSATLPTITITADADDSYTSDVTSSATGLDLEFKESPKTVTVVTEQALKDQNLTNVEEVVIATSGISTRNMDANRTQFFARGFQINEFNVDGTRPTYGTGSGEGAHLSSTAIYDKVEVVKGANGLMGGSGNPSATINLTRKHANSAEFSGEVSATYDRFGTYGTMVDVGSKLNKSGSIRGRVVVDYTAGDTYVDMEDKANKTAYGVVNIDVTDNTTVSIGANHQEKIQDGVMWGGLALFYTDGSRIDWDANQSMSTDWQKRSSVTDEFFASLKHNFNDDWQLAVNTNYADTNGDMQVIYIDGYVYKPNGLVIDGIDPATGAPTPESPYSVNLQNSLKDFNIKTELTGNFDAFDKQHKIMLGADYNKYEEKGSVRRGVDNPPVKGIVNDWDGSYPISTWGEEFNFSEKVQESAFYGSMQLNIADPLALVIGSRISNYKYVDDSATQEHKAVVTPFIGATYKINDSTSVFASYTDVFKPQSEKNVEGKYLDPIKGKNIEVGIKGTNDAETIQVQFSIFKIEQDNLAQADTGKYIAGTEDVAGNYPGDDAYYGAEGATSKGLEVEITGKLTDKLEGSLGYTHFNIEDANGNAIDTMNANTTINLFTKYDMSDYISGLTIGGGVQWDSERYFLYENELKGGTIEKIGQSPSTSVNLMLNYQVNDNLDIQMNVNNALDENNMTYNYYEQVDPREPLNITGKISYKW